MFNSYVTNYQRLPAGHPPQAGPQVVHVRTRRLRDHLTPVSHPRKVGKCGIYRIQSWVWVNTYRYIFSGMNIHLPAILMFTRGTRF